MKLNAPLLCEIDGKLINLSHLSYAYSKPHTMPHQTIIVMCGNPDCELILNVEYRDFIALTAKACASSVFKVE